MKLDFQKSLSDTYWVRYKKYGSVPEGVFWASKNRQELRFKLILDEIYKIDRSSKLKLSDVGCGYGALVSYIKSSKKNFNIRYTGYDISQKLIGICNEQFDEDWVKFRVGTRPSELTDYSVMSGTYNLAATSDIFDWEEYVWDCLWQCWQYTAKAMIFNLQIAETATITNSHIYYSEKAHVLEKCVSAFGPTKLVIHRDLPNDVLFVVLK